jgi:hypothetical protein
MLLMVLGLQVTSRNRVLRDCFDGCRFASTACDENMGGAACLSYCFEGCRRRARTQEIKKSGKHHLRLVASPFVRQGSTTSASTDEMSCESGHYVQLSYLQKQQEVHVQCTTCNTGWVSILTYDFGSNSSRVGVFEQIRQNRSRLTKYDAYWVAQNSSAYRCMHCPPGKVHQIQYAFTTFISYARPSRTVCK